MRYLSGFGVLALGLAIGMSIGIVAAQEMPLSGTSGIDLVWTTSQGTSQLLAISLLAGSAPVPVGAPVAAVPSRWAHRRRTLGALETDIAYAAGPVLMTPMGDATGNGAIHFVDARLGLPPISGVVATGNPAGYDLALADGLKFVFAAEDNGAGQTVLRGFSYATPGALVPLNPPFLTIPGSPSAYVNRMGVDLAEQKLHVPTTGGIQIVSLSAASPNMAATAFVSSGTRSAATNPSRFVRNGVETWAIGTCAFNALDEPTEAGFLSWDQSGASYAGAFGIIPGLAPARAYVPAAGCEELAVVSDGTSAYAYFLLRDPSPTALFIRPSAVGVVRFTGSNGPVASKIIYPEAGGEPFSIPSVHGARIAIESSGGPPFYYTPADGSERIAILYTPLDPLGAGSLDGILKVSGPLGGRISTKGMDRPLWSRDGTRVAAFTSHFPGAPNPGVPGLEILDVPVASFVNEFMTPHTVVPNATFPNQSIFMPAAFAPRDPAAAAFLAPFSFFGAVFHDGMAGAMTLPFGELGTRNESSPIFTQSSEIPNFPAIFPPSFEDASGSLVTIPGNFGARRTAFNLYPGLGLTGLVHSVAMDDTVLIQPCGYNMLAGLGLMPWPLAPLAVSLGAGSITTSEFLSL